MKIAHGTTAWFGMVGSLMVEAAVKAKLPPGLQVSLVERYTDGIDMGEGLVQGLRFDIIGGQPSFRLGARRDERGDITIEVTAAGSRTLNALRGDTPYFHAALAELQASGELKVDGDFSQLGSWFGAVHDLIVDRTR